MKTKRILSAVLALFITLAFSFPIAGTAAVNEVKLPNAAEYKKQIESKYSIPIEDLAGVLKEADAEKYLRNIDEALGKYSLPFVKEIVGIAKKDKNPLKIRLHYIETADDPAGYARYAKGKELTIHIYYSTPQYYRFGGDGSTDTIIHEFGHCVHFIAMGRYGQGKMKSEWDRLNKGYPYGEWDDGYYSAYTSQYGATSYYEDVAEVFTILLDQQETMKEILSENIIIRQKVQFLENILKSCFGTFSPDIWLAAKPTGPVVLPVPTIEQVKKIEKILINGKQLVIPDGMGNFFVDENGYTQAPVKLLAEALGYKMDFISKTNTVIILKDKNIVATITLGQMELSVKGKAMLMNTHAGMAGGRAYVPVGYLVDALGCKMSVSDWGSPQGGTIAITVPKK